MENDLRVKYDCICYKTLLNLQYLTKDAERIVLKNFDYQDDEHQFILAIVAACSGLLGDREVAIDVNIFYRKSLTKKYPCLGKIKRVTGKDKKVVDVPELLEFMRPSAVELCGEWFLFDDIYNEYYNRKEEQ